MLPVLLIAIYTILVIIILLIFLFIFQCLAVVLSSLGLCSTRCALLSGCLFYDGCSVLYYIGMVTLHLYTLSIICFILLTSIYISSSCFVSLISSPIFILLLTFHLCSFCISVSSLNTWTTWTGCPTYFLCHINPRFMLFSYLFIPSTFLLSY